MKMKSLKLSLLLGAAVAAMNLAAVADGPQAYKALPSKAAVSALKPGSQVAHECPHCGTIAVSKVGNVLFCLGFELGFV